MQFISQYRKELHASPSPVPRSHSESDPPERRTFACAQLWRQMTLCLARMWKPGCGRYAGGVNADAGLDSGAHRWNSIRAKGPEGKRQQQRILHVSPKVSCTLGCGRFLSGAPSPSACLVGVFISSYYRALRVDLPSEYVRWALSPGSRSVRKVDLRVSGIRACWSLPLPSLFTRECEYPLHAVKSEQDAPMVRV